MQKFTVFSLLLSFSVILILSDIVFHDYLDESKYESAVSSGAESVEQSASQDSGQNTLNDSENMNEASGDSEADIQENSQRSNEQISSVSLASIPEPKMTAEALKMAGFVNPILKEAVFSGNIFNFIGFTDQPDAFIYQWNFFEGENFIGSIYELEYASDTGGFQAYLTLRQRAMDLFNLGTVNETNSYGDTSFYFNHKSKTKTVHLIIRKANSVYGFEYAYVNHEKMKPLFSIISE